MKILPLTLIILLIAAGIGFIIFWPPDSNTRTNSQTQTTTNQTTVNNTSNTLQGIPAIKAYAALQFNVPEDQVTIVSSEKQDWEDICLDLPIPNYECTKQAVSGYEVVVEIDGNQTKYRGSDDGSIIRVVKTLSPESLTGAAASPSPEASSEN